MTVILEPAAKELVKHLNDELVEWHEGKPSFNREAERVIVATLYWAYNYGLNNGRFLKGAEESLNDLEP